MDISKLISGAQSALATVTHVAQLAEQAADSPIGKLVFPQASGAIHLVQGAIQFVSDAQIAVKTAGSIASASDRATLDKIQSDLQAQADLVHKAVQALT